MRPDASHSSVPDMVLRSTLTSPYGRKVRIAALVLGLNNQIKLVPADTLDPEDDLRQQNPLGKMPCLIVGADFLFDSRVILDYLDALAGGGRLCPAAGIERFRVRTRSVLADGVTDAALLMTYEIRFRDAPQVSPRWLDHQRGKIFRAMASLSAAPPDPARSDMAAISLACALGYLDWRRPVDWRSEHPVLVDWLEAFRAAEPAFDETEGMP